MKYIVEVNAKYLVSIEAESLLNAEHKLLAYNGVWGAMAYDRAMMKTDTFAGAVQGCEMVSITEIVNMADELMAQKKEAVQAQIDAEDANNEVERLTKLLEEAKKNALDANRKKSDALYEYHKIEEKFGKQRN